MRQLVCMIKLKSSCVACAHRYMSTFKFRKESWKSALNCAREDTERLSQNKAKPEAGLEPYARSVRYHNHKGNEKGVCDKTAA